MKILKNNQTRFPEIDYGITALQAWNEKRDMSTHMANTHIPTDVISAGTTAAIYESRTQTESLMRSHKHRYDSLFKTVSKNSYHVLYHYFPLITGISLTISGNAHITKHWHSKLHVLETTIISCEFCKRTVMNCFYRLMFYSCVVSPVYARGNSPLSLHFPTFYSIFYFFLFPFLLASSIFLLFHPFPFYQSSYTPFSGRMS